MVTATIATQVSIRGTNPVSISNFLEVGEVIKERVHLSEDPKHIDTFTLPKSNLKMILVKKIDNNYLPPSKVIKYRFNNVRSEPWIPLDGPLLVFEENLIRSLRSKLKSLYFKNESRREEAIDILLATDNV